MPPRYAKSWVEELNVQGFSVCGIDQQGCGFSSGLECYVERFDDYVDDVLQFARRARLAARACFLCPAEWLHVHASKGRALTLGVPPDCCQPHAFEAV